MLNLKKNFLILVSVLSLEGWTFDFDADVVGDGIDFRSRSLTISHDFTPLWQASASHYQASDAGSVSSSELRLGASHTPNVSLEIDFSISRGREIEYLESQKFSVGLSYAFSDLWQGERQTWIGTELTRGFYTLLNQNARNTNYRRMDWQLFLSQELTTWLSLSVSYTDYRYSLKNFSRRSYDERIFRLGQNLGDSGHPDQSYRFSAKLKPFEKTRLSLGFDKTTGLGREGNSEAIDLELSQKVGGLWLVPSYTKVRAQTTTEYYGLGLSFSF